MSELVALQQRLFRLWWNNVEASANAFATIALRLPLLASQDPTRGTAEAQRMVREKVAALAEGGFAAGRQASRSLGKAPADALGIAEALSRPAHKRVRANAKRLSAKTRRK
jgi:hypothetical protein